MHKKISLHQAGFFHTSNSVFIAHCQAIGLSHMTMVTNHLAAPGGMAETQRALAAGDTNVATLNHVFGHFPDLQRDSGEAAAKLIEAIGIAGELGAERIYLVSGGRGALDWEAGAERFGALLAPCREPAAARGVRLLV